MAASLNELFKPAKFNADPNSSAAGKEFKHWLKTFDNFIESVVAQAEAAHVHAPNKLKVLCAHVSANVYELIEDCGDYETAVQKLKEIYLKTPNVIFARHLLATRKQQPGESLQEFLQSLHILSKDCNFRNVTADEYRLDLVRDAFINGLASHHIRQRLLENAELTVNQAYKTAMSLHLAQEHSAAYFTENSRSSAATMMSEQSILGTEAETPTTTSCSSHTTQMLQAVSKVKICFFCGKEYHDRNKCPARNATCYSCGKKGHFGKVCRSKSTGTTSSLTMPRSVSHPSSHSPSLCITTAACPGSLIKSSIPVNINGKCFTALIDSGSSESYVNYNVCKKLNLDIYPSQCEVQMASSTMKMKSKGFCLADVTIKGVKYESTRLNTFENLCSDVILGLDFQSQHSRLVFEFGGTSPELVIQTNESSCALAAAKMEAVSLFSNLSSDVKPIATKSRRFSKEDQEFIQETVDKWKEEGIIQPSSSPWRAQVVVVKDELNRRNKRLCVDYSQTINIYTELDAYPLPRIDDMINSLSKYSVFSTFDLRSAYHQVELVPSERKFTAFEANGNLFEFTRIPFGVKNGVAVFQRKITQFISEEKLKDTVAYLDNVTVAGRNQLEHDDNVKAFLDAINRRNFTLNETKTVKSVSNINILGYVVGNMHIKPDPERMQPLLNFPPPSNYKALRRVLGMFAYYAKWINCFADKVRPLADAKEFPLSANSLNAFNLLKNELSNAALQSIDECLPFVVECDASDVAISATLNQGGRPVAFMSRTLQGSEIYYPAFEKEATAIIEAVRKWSHLLSRNTFTLITDQRSVSFMLDSRRRTKIKNDKIQQWRMELASFSYVVKYRPGQRNVGPDTLTRAFSASISSLRTLEELHNQLCHPGITRFLHFVRTKNLPFSTTEVKQVVSGCKVCAEIKPAFTQSNDGTLLKATQSMERLSVDFKGPLMSSTANKYLFVVIDEYSRFPFAFPCKDMTTSTVIGCLDKLFAICGTPGFIHSDNGPCFVSQEFRDYLLRRGISSSKSSVYHPSGNGQAERTVQTVWKTIKLALHAAKLPSSHWEVVLADCLHSMRSLLCTSTNATPHERFFNFNRRSHTGVSLPSWMTLPGSKAYLRRFVRSSKSEPLVDEVEIVHVNPKYANVRNSSGREMTVSLKDLAPCPPGIQLPSMPAPLPDEEATEGLNEGLVSDFEHSDEPSTSTDKGIQSVLPRRSSRANKGVPPQRFGVNE